jgi:hypothetical protein
MLAVRAPPRAAGQGVAGLVGFHCKVEQWVEIVGKSMLNASARLSEVSVVLGDAIWQSGLDVSSCFWEEGRQTWT